MKEKKFIRQHWLGLRLSVTELNQLKKLASKTTSRSLSDYARQVLLQQPVRVLYRNQSADDFLADMLSLKKELNALGNNFNQAVHKLHTLDHTPDIQRWAQYYSQYLEKFEQSQATIEQKMQQVYEQWLQK